MIEKAAARWLATQPDVKVTRADLSKTLQQLLTETFRTGTQRRGGELPAYARSVLEATGVDTDGFASARTFTKSADLPDDHGRAFDTLATSLAPLAAAIQLARIPVTDAAARRLADFESAERIDRRQLRGFAVARIRPYAQDLLARVGVGERTETYLRLLLDDVDEIATAVVSSAVRKRSQPARLDELGARRLSDLLGEHLGRLRREANTRYGAHAEDVIGATLLKLTVAHRNDPDRTLSYPFLRTVMINSANDHYNALTRRRIDETVDVELIEVAVDDRTAAVEASDAAVRTVLAAASSLAGDGGDGALAREALLRYFLADPADLDPRRARLAETALDLTTADDAAGGLWSGLDAVAATLAVHLGNADRIARLAMAALRAQAPAADAA